jgi:hypothetical protein
MALETTGARSCSCVLVVCSCRVSIIQCNHHEQPDQLVPQIVSKLQHDTRKKQFVFKLLQYNNTSKRSRRGPNSSAYVIFTRYNSPNLSCKMCPPFLHCTGHHNSGHNSHRQSSAALKDKPHLPISQSSAALKDKPHLPIKQAPTTHPKPTPFTPDYPLLVIGAGPHALAFITKLIEKNHSNPNHDILEENPTNKTLFKHSKKRIISKYKILPDHIFSQKDKTMRTKFTNAIRDKKRHEQLLKQICVVDRNARWLSQWKHQFKMLAIPNLRSSLYAHSDPIDPQCMRLWIQDNHDRDSSVIKVKIKRSLSYHGPYEVPKTSIFNKFSDTIVSRYHLNNAITQGKVQDVQLVKHTTTTTKHHFNVIVTNKEGKQTIISASSVVFASGPLNIPVFPEFYSSLDQEGKDSIPAGKITQLPHHVGARKGKNRAPC